MQGEEADFRGIVHGTMLKQHMKATAPMKVARQKLCEKFSINHTNYLRKAMMMIPKTMPSRN